MKGSFVLVVFIILIALACGCMSPISSMPQPTPSSTPTESLTIAINATPTRYNPAMSSTIGIRLTPVNTSGVLPPDARFTWETDYGTFYQWGPPDFKVVELAPRFTGTREPVYWSYFAEPLGGHSRPVTIALTVRSPSWGILANASLRVGWEPPDGVTAIVENSG